MPILGREPDLYPDDLFSSHLALPEDESWFAMYTMARREKELMRQLRALKIAHYGPITAQRTRSPQGRIRISHVLTNGWASKSGFAPGDEWVAIGEGDEDWPEVLKALGEIGYDGWATSEVAGGGEKELRDIAERMNRVLALG